MILLYIKHLLLNYQEVPGIDKDISEATWTGKKTSQKVRDVDLKTFWLTNFYKFYIIFHVLLPR